MRNRETGKARQWLGRVLGRVEGKFGWANDKRPTTRRSGKKGGSRNPLSETITAPQNACFIVFWCRKRWRRDPRLHPSNCLNCRLAGLLTFPDRGDGEKERECWRACCEGGFPWKEMRSRSLASTPSSTRNFRSTLRGTLPSHFLGYPFPVNLNLAN